MGVVTPVSTSRRSLATVRERDRIAFLDNPLTVENPTLGRALEQEIRRLLTDEDIGPIEVRFRVCRNDDDAFCYICKVENPPFDGEDGRVQWRWWSPLMRTADDLREALADGLRIRRERLESAHPRSA
jgi:hypothetical protein